tara:strand:- start:90 stop:347 length:258 start_codon:yes stop_codon:yes gene_type:complete
MVWISKKIILLSLLLFFSTNLFSNELNDNEKMYFNFIDINNDNQISLSEIEQSINIIFQIIDFNQDGFLSKSEINEIKNIIDSLR